MRKKSFSRILYFVLSLFVAVNVVAAFHAYKFTHFAAAGGHKTHDGDSLTISEKVLTLLIGVDNPRPENTEVPDSAFERIMLKSNKKIECWLIRASHPKSTVILFHGYSSCKSKMLDKAREYTRMGHNVLLVDFMGSGGSDGNQTTIGYYEAKEVDDCYQYARQHLGNSKIFLFGTSMGAAAVMRAVAQYALSPAGIIIECPFGTMYETTCARFRQMNVPVFPMAAMLVFWGGVENGFNAFGHNPRSYAGGISCPTLLLYGLEDNKVSVKEINEIYGALRGYKELKTYATAGHDNYLTYYRDQWRHDVSAFIDSQLQ